MIHIVTFPRSGHHLLMNMLFKYYSQDLNYPEIQGHQTSNKCKEIINVNGLKYCELYNHCQKTGCTEEVDIQKNHDFGLKKGQAGLMLPDNSNVIVQIRQPVDAIISYYKFSNAKNWDKFFNSKLEYYKKFIEKWKDNYLIKYESLINEPLETMIYLLKYMGHTEIDIDLLVKITQKTICKQRDITKFKHYNPKMEKVNDTLYNF